MKGTTIISFAFFLLLIMLIYPQIYDKKLAPLGDNAAYYIGGKSISSGQGYSLVNDPGLISANHFPPGYPFIIGMLFLVTESSIDISNQLNAIFLFGLICLTYLFTQRLGRQKLFSILLCVFILLNQNVLKFSTITMSEIPFSFFLLISLLLYISLQDAENKLKNWKFYALLVSSIVVFYIRTQGGVLAISFFLSFLFQKEFKTAIVYFFIFALLILPWQIRSQRLGGSSYVKSLFLINPYQPDKGKMDQAAWITRIKDNAVRYVSKEIPSGFFPAIKVDYTSKNNKPNESPLWLWIFGLACIVGVIYGIWLHQNIRIFFYLFFTGTACVLLLWPQVWFGTRFILPYIPIASYFLFIGVGNFLKIIAQRTLTFKTHFAWSFLLLPLIYTQIKPIKELHQQATLPQPINWVNFYELAKWTKLSLPEKAVIVNRKPDLFYVISEHKSIGFPNTLNEKEFINYFEKKKVTHVILEQLGFSQTGLYLAPFLINNSDKFKLVNSFGSEETNSGVWIYEYNAKFGYQGGYKNGKKEGKGILLQQNGAIIEGNWHNGLQENQGKWTLPDKKVFTGKWTNGKKNGPFDLTVGNQLILTYWKNDTLQQKAWILDSNRKKTRTINVK